MRASIKHTLSSIFVAVAIVAVVLFTWLQKFPFLMWEKESNGFFAWTDDYLEWVLSMPAPASVFCGDFLTQFFRFPLLGGLIQALGVLVVWLSLTVVMRRFRFPRWLEWIAVLPAAGLWWLQLGEEAMDSTLPFAWFCLATAAYVSLPWRWVRILVAIPTFFFLPTGAFIGWVVVVLVLEGALYAGWTFPHTRDRYFLSPVLSIVIFGACCLFLMRNESLQKNERWANIRYLAYSERWNKLYDLVCQQEIYENMEVPYMLLALSQRQQLGDYIFHYPINSEEYYLYIGMGTRDAYFFNQLFYAHLGMYNEAIHMAYQEKTRTRYPMSFRILMNLVRFEKACGDYRQADKYLDLLGRATCYGGWVAKHRPTREQIDGTDTSKGVSTFFITDSTLKNLYYEVQMGSENLHLHYYYLNALLIRKNLLAFTKHINDHPFLLEERIPRHFWEAIILAKAQGFTVNNLNLLPGLYESFMDFQQLLGAQDKASIMKNYRYTYWFNYYFLTFPEDKAGGIKVVQKG